MAVESKAPSHWRLGLLGCGTMGTTLGLRALRLGLPLTVFNRTRDKTRALVQAGARVAERPAEVMDASDATISLLTDSTALDALLLGPGGALRGLSRPCLILDMATNTPGGIARTADAVRAAGSSLLEAPVTGSVHDVEHGTLCFLCGGERETYERARPLLDILGRRSFHFGPVGSGATAKVDVEAFLAALALSGLSSPLYERVGRRYLDRDFAARFSLANLDKDVRAIHALSGQLGRTLPLLDTLAEQLRGVGGDACGRDYSFLLARASGAGQSAGQAPMEGTVE